MKTLMFTLCLLSSGFAFAVTVTSEDAASCHKGGAETIAGSSAFFREPTGEVKSVDSKGPNGEFVKVVTFQGMPLKGLNPSMMGPWSRTYFKLLPSQESPSVWITGYRAEVQDEKGSASQEFMCHTNLDVVRMGKDGEEYEHSQLSISQGQKEIQLPKGFGLKIDNGPLKKIDLMVMVLNNNYPDLDKKLNFKSTITYFSEAQAKAKGLKALEQTSVFIECDMDKPQPGQKTPCHTATTGEILTDEKGGRRTGHWLVPPGRQQISMDVTSQLALTADTKLHYIWMHVHPYAKSLELKDTTTGKTVWRGEARGDKKLAVVHETDHYVSETGLPVFKNHKYEFSAVYDNPTHHDVDAMASLWMYAAAVADGR